MSQNSKIDEWRPVKDWEGFYEVSSQGDVRSVDRYIVDVNRGSPRSRRFLSKVLRPASSPSGHTRVGLYANGRGRNALVHRIVALAFLDNPGKLPVVDHIDGDPSNNNVGNLRWATYDTNNNNTPYIRYLQDLLKCNDVEYIKEDEYAG